MQYESVGCNHLLMLTEFLDASIDQYINQYKSSCPSSHPRINMIQSVGMAFHAWILAALTFFDSLNQLFDPFPTENLHQQHIFFLATQMIGSLAAWQRKLSDEICPTLE